MKNLLWFLVGLLISGVIGVGSAHAGYYATVTSSNAGSVYAAVGQSSACYLTPSMALSAMRKQDGTTFITSLSLSDAAGYITSPAANWTASVGTCTASPAVTSFPTFLAGSSDPAITADGMVNAGGGGTCSTESWLSGLTPEQGSQIAGSILLIWALAWVFRQLVWALKHIDDYKETS